MKLKQLKKLGLPGKSHVTLSCSDGQDVFHYTDDDHEGQTVIETGIATKVAGLVTNRALANNNLITELRNWDLLEDYERGEGYFQEYVAEAIVNNWRGYGLLDVTTEIYDHKRGFSKVTAEVNTTMSEVLKLDENSLTDWAVKVQLGESTLEIQ